MGRLIKTTYPDGAHEDTTYDAEGRRLTSTDRAGHLTSYTYDELGRLTRVTFADGTFTATAFDAIGRVSSSTDERGNTTTYEYDPNCGCSLRRSKITDALGHVTTFTYDASGNQLTMTDSRGNTTTYEYDANNRRTRTTYEDGSFGTVVYDPLGRAISKTDQAGKVTQFAYESPARLVKVTDALGQETRYAYDEVGNQVSQTDALNHTTRYDYDQLGRRTKRTLPGGQSETYAYLSTGSLQSRIDFNGKTTTYSYDVMNRLLAKTPDPSLSQSPATFTYNTMGQRATMSDASGATTYNYNTRNRLTSKQTPNGTLTYTYDGSDNLVTTRSSNPNGVNVDYGYDALNRLATVKDNSLPAGSNTTTYAYDDAGNMQTYTYPNGLTTTQTYNSLNRLTALTVTAGPVTLAGYNYTLGASGNRLSVSEQGGRVVNYTYDSLYRLTNEAISGSSVSSENGVIGYGYDAVGNRLTRTSTLSAVPSTANSYDLNDRLTSDTYDNNGNTTHANNMDYAYDFENRLTSANGGTVSFVYDGDGNRVAKTVNGVTTKYLVDSNNPSGYPQVVDELIGNQVTRTYTFGHSLISQRQLIGGQWLVSFYGYDGQGSVRLLTDFAGGVTDTYTYDAFGNLIAATGTTPNEHLYVGEQFDANIGFYYLRARYMNPVSGRFWSFDSHEGSVYDPASLHKYLYAGADPVNKFDPTGQSFLIFESIGAATELGVQGWGGIMGAAFLAYIRFLLIGIAITVITATTIEIAKRLELPIRVFHYTDLTGLAKIAASNQIKNPTPGKPNYFTLNYYLFGATARDELAVCRPLHVGIQLNVYLSSDGIGPTTPVQRRVCPDLTVEKGGASEMSTLRPVPFLTRQPAIYPLF